MPTRRIALIARLLAIASLLALGVVGAPSVSAGNPCFHDFTMPPATSESGTEIKLLPCAFAPTVTQVPVGATVTFFNGPNFSHLITGANQAWGSPDVELQPGATVSYTFDKAGIYPYACVLHPGMSGAIVVGDLAEGAGAGTTTDTGSNVGATAGGESAAGGESNASEPSASAAGPADPTLAGLAIIALGAGLIVGAGAVWLALRRRQFADRTLAKAD
jgi:plastocyanin